jgi:hypothetical protein
MLPDMPRGHTQSHPDGCRTRPGRRVRAACAALVGAALLLQVTPVASAPEPIDAGRPLTSVFFIAKSENRNQVHYGVRVDANCRPKGKRPVYAYWRDLEDGPKATSPILKHELPAYGINRPHWIKQYDDGGRMRISLRGFPERPLILETYQRDARCRARALTKIKDQSALLRSIYVALGFLFSVDYVVVHGLRVADGRPIQEKMDG